MSHESLDSAFDALIDVNVPVHRLVTGCTFTEGPIWHPVKDYLLFSDMPADKRRRWDSSGVSEVSNATYKANGMTYDDELNLIVCEHASSSLVRLAPDGTRTVLASHFEGRELNSPNDVCQHSGGALYFTDPYYGRLPHFGVERPRQLGWQGVFRVLPGTDASQDPDLLVDRYLFSQPNGLCFSPDETQLYVNDTEQANIRVFDVDNDGRLRNGRLFASGIRDAKIPGVPDGMKCDEHGNVWVTAPGGLWVYNPAGRLLGKISIPELSANLHWGGADWRTLFVCATHSLYSVTTRTGPRTEPFMRHSGTGSARWANGGATGGTNRASVAESSVIARDSSTGGRATAKPELASSLMLDADRCALIIQDMQNDVVSDGGAFADSGSPLHCRQQGAVENIRRLAAACRNKGIPVIHVWFQCEPGHPGITLNAPLFEGLVDSNALIRGTWGAAPVDGLEPVAGDHIVTKMRMSAFEGTALETILKSEGRDIIIETGAWTNMSIEHTARTGADKGYTMVIPEDGCSTMNADWHNAAISYALTNVAAVTRVSVVVEALQ
jgi:gluconolactonase